MKYVVKDGYLLQVLEAYKNVTFSNFGINITRITPPETPQQDIDNLKKLLNDIANVTTVRHVL